MTAAEKAVQWAVSIAEDAAHGYSQTDRWGPDYDCSSLVIEAYERAGVPVKTKGATYTGNMLKVFKACGFREVNISERKRGDVLLAHNNSTGKGHTALCTSKTELVMASIDENGRTSGGKKGDQTGREILVRSYYSKPWNYCLRPPETKEDETQEEKTVNIQMQVLEQGAKGEQVRTLQILINTKGHFRLETDGSFGSLTRNAVCSFQRLRGLEPVDGCVGQKTWEALLK